MELQTLMGHAPAKVDEKGRLKIPNDFRRLIEERYGPACFLTSLHGDRAVVYPLPVYEAFQERIQKLPSTSPVRARLLQRLNYFGQVSTIDAQGRVLIPAVLRNMASIKDDVVVLGNTDHLEIWSGEKIQKQLAEEPLTADDFKELELYGV